MKVRQAVRLVPKDGGEGEIIITLPMDVDTFAKFIGPLGKKGWLLAARDREGLPPELIDVPDVFLPIAQAAYDAINTDGAHHKQHALGDVLELAGGLFPEGVDRGIPA